MAGFSPERVEAASLLKDQASKSQKSSFLSHGIGQSKTEPAQIHGFGSRFHLFMGGVMHKHTRRHGGRLCNLLYSHYVIR